MTSRKPATVAPVASGQPKLTAARLRRLVRQVDDDDLDPPSISGTQDPATRRRHGITLADELYPDSLAVRLAVETIVAELLLKPRDSALPASVATIAAKKGSGGFVGRCPSDESLGYDRSSLAGRSKSEAPGSAGEPSVHGIPGRELCHVGQGRARRSTPAVVPRAPKRRAEDCRAPPHADLASAAGRRQSQRHTLPVSRPARCPTWAKLGSRTSVRAGTSANQSNWRPRTEASQNGRIGSGAFHRQKKARTPHSAFEEPTNSPNPAIRKSAVAGIESGRGNPVTAAKAWTTAPVRTPIYHAGSRPNRCAAAEARFWGGCPFVAGTLVMLHGVRAWTS